MKKWLLSAFVLPSVALAQDPWLVSTDTINSGDTAWIMTSAVLVLFMTLPGLALFYGGMVRKKKSALHNDAQFCSSGAGVSLVGDCRL